MNMRKWLDQMNETLLDLIIGCLVYSMLFEIIGLIVVEHKVSWTFGILLGTAVAIGSAISMAAGIEHVLNMDQRSAAVESVLYSIIRTIVMFVAAWIGMKSKLFSFSAVIVGMIGLKIAAHLHVYTNVYITKKIRRKGR